MWQEKGREKVYIIFSSVCVCVWRVQVGSWALQDEQAVGLTAVLLRLQSCRFWRTVILLMGFNCV